MFECTRVLSHFVLEYRVIAIDLLNLVDLPLEVAMMPRYGYSCISTAVYTAVLDDEKCPLFKFDLYIYSNIYHTIYNCKLRSKMDLQL